jgi:hypothetical protein
MTRTTAMLATLSLILLAPAAASADSMPAATVDTGSTASDYAFGMRVGGYGFRNTHAESASEKWNDCRMNGVGVFGHKKLSEHGFLEGGSDIYFSDNFILGADEATHSNMDRLSGLFSVAAGLRMFPSSRFSAFAQVGLGLELTRVTLSPAEHSHDPGAMDDPVPLGQTEVENTAMPLGFVGFGADVRLGQRTRLGMNFRTYLMAHYDHGDGITSLNAEPEAANQVQFYLRYQL